VTVWGEPWPCGFVGLMADVYAEKIDSSTGRLDFK